MKTIKILFSLCIVFSLAACQTTPDSVIKKEHLGTVAGAVGGAWLGSNIGKGTGNIIGIAAGTLLGGYLGNQIGASLDRADLAMHERTSQSALENTRTNTTSNWNNPDTGARGSITPTTTYQNASGQYCREYTQAITVGGKTEKAVGRACRQPDGTWKIVE